MLQQPAWQLHEQLLEQLQAWQEAEEDQQVQQQLLLLRPVSGPGQYLKMGLAEKRREGSEMWMQSLSLRVVGGCCQAAALEVLAWEQASDPKALQGLLKAGQ